MLGSILVFGDPINDETKSWKLRDALQSGCVGISERNELDSVEMRLAPLNIIAATNRQRYLPFDESALFLKVTAANP